MGTTDSPLEDLGLVDAVVQLSFSIQAVVADAAAAHDLSLTQARLLGILRDREPPMLELARFLGLQKSSVTGLVERAERRGLVARTAGAHDGRSTVVALTTPGHRLVRALAERVTAEISALLVDLEPAEQAELSRLASRLVHRDALHHGIDLGASPGPA